MVAVISEFDSYWNCCGYLSWIGVILALSQLGQSMQLELIVRRVDVALCLLNVRVACVKMIFKENL